MKNLLFIILILIPNISQSQNWQWSKQVGGDGSQSQDYGYVFTDGTYNYLYGTFSGQMKLQTDTFYSNGNSDFYIIKYDANGTEIWAKAFGGNNNINQSEFLGCVFDTINNSIYLSGSFWGNMILGNDTIHGNVFYNNFLAKMDINGNFLWAKNAWTKNTFNLNNNDKNPVLTIQQDGIINMTTSVIDTAYFDGMQAIPGGCMAKFNSNGDCIYVRHFYDFANFYVGGFGIKFINTDMILYGSFTQTFDIDTATLISHGDYDMFLARADSSGNIKWIKQFGYGSTDYITNLVISNNTDLYSVGGFTDSISFNTNTYYNPSSDFIFMKFDLNGNFLLGKQAHSSTNFMNPGSMAIDSDGNSYVCGSFTGSASFDNYNISTSNMNDMFLARFNSSGDCLGVKHFGKANGGNVVIDNLGNPVVAGTFANTVSIGGNTYTSLGPFDIYLAKSDIFTGVGEEKSINSNQLIIYANPNKGTFNIKIPDDIKSFKDAWLLVYDNSGKEIQRFSLANQSDHPHFDISNSTNGNYTVRLIQGSKVYVGKMVVE